MQVGEEDWLQWVRLRRQKEGAGQPLTQAVDVFVQASVELLRQMLLPPPYSWVEGLVEREVEAAVNSADAVSWSYFNYDLAKKK